MKTVALSEVAEIVSGATPKTQVTEFWNGEILWVTPADLSKLRSPFIDSTPRTITAAGLNSCAATVLPPGSVLLSSRAPIGHVAINTAPMATNQGFKSLIPQSDRADAKYLYHWLKSKTDYLQGLGNGATFKEVSKATVSRIEIPLPALDEQRRIATILDHADALRAARHQVIAHLDDLARSIFLDMFGDPISNERSWPLTTLGDLGRWRSGATPPRSKPEYFQGEVPWFSSGELDDRYTRRSAEYVSAAALNDTSLKRVPAGSLMLGMYDTAALKSSIATVECTCNQAVAFAPIDPQLANVIYVYEAIQIGRERLRRLQRGIRQKNLNLSIVREIELALPPIDGQHEYSKRVECVETAAAHARNAASEAESLVASLQFRAFRGEL